MVITTVLFYVVAREHFGWSRAGTLVLCGVFLAADLAFFGANIPKIPHGGWFPLVAGGVVFAILTTWKTGRSIVRDRTQRGRTTLADYLEGVRGEDSPRVPGTAVYLFGIPDMAPPPLVYNHRFNKVLHEQNIALTVVTEEIPRVRPVERVERTDLGGGFEKIVMRYGFMEEPTVGDDLRQLEDFDHEDTIYFLGRESVHVTAAPGMAPWREHLFVFLKRNATSAVDYFNLPHDRVVEILTQVDL
jgi:KUP system potassium uptake protein